MKSGRRTRNLDADFFMGVGHDEAMDAHARRRTFVALLWLAIGLSAVAGMKIANAAYIGPESLHKSSAGRHDTEAIEAAGMLLGVFVAGAAFGVAIEAFTGKRWHLPIVGIFASSGILLGWAWIRFHLGL
jgi:hypothetical protein